MVWKMHIIQSTSSKKIKWQIALEIKLPFKISNVFFLVQVVILRIFVVRIEICRLFLCYAMYIIYLVGCSPPPKWPWIIIYYPKAHFIVPVKQNWQIIKFIPYNNRAAISQIKMPNVLDTFKLIMLHIEGINNMFDSLAT